MSVFCRQVREQDISVDGTCLNGEGRNTGAGECFCVGFRSSIGDEADFSGCRGCMNGRIGKVVREMEFHGTVDGFCCQGLGTGSLEEDFAVTPFKAAREQSPVISSLPFVAETSRLSVRRRVRTIFPFAACMRQLDAERESPVILPFVAEISSVVR